MRVKISDATITVDESVRIERGTIWTDSTIFVSAGATITVGDGGVVTGCRIVVASQEPVVSLEDGGTLTYCYIEGFQPA